MDWRDIPARISVHGKPWRVRWVRGLKMPDGDRAHGVCWYKARRIELDEALRKRPRLLARTWTHELLHAHMPLRRADGRPRMDLDEEETLVERLEWIANVLIPRARRRRA